MYQPLYFTVCSAMLYPQTLLPTALLHLQLRTDYHSPTSTTPNSCQPWTALRPWSAHNADIAARDRRGGTCIMWSHGSHVTSSRALCGPPSTPLRCCIIMQYWHKVVGAACLAVGHTGCWCHCSHAQHSVKGRAVRTRCLLDLK